MPTIPDDFPREAYNQLRDRVAQLKTPSSADAFDHCVLALRAIPYRFRACAEHDEAWTAEYSQLPFSGPAGTLEAVSEAMQGYVYEQEFFGFIVTGFTTLETVCYSLYMLGAMVKPQAFPIRLEGNLKQINVEGTSQRYGKVFKGEDLTRRLAQVAISSQFKDWAKIRNVLAHRLTPRPVLQGLFREGEELPIHWAPGVTLGEITYLQMLEGTTSSMRTWLAATLTGLLEAAVGFVDTHRSR